MTTLSNIDLTALKNDYERLGYAIARQLFTPEEVDEIKVTFEDLRLKKHPPGFDDGIKDPNDPLYAYHRFVHPHRHNDVARHYMLHPRVRECLEFIIGEEPVATQSMYYFKPPGARGQALHQDNLYLLVEPGTCLAAWTAIDRCDRENGGLMVVPHTQNGNILCPEVADAKESWTNQLVRPPKGTRAIDVPMEPGDTLFFNGSTIHGSGPNRSKDRFRRSFIGHYAAGSLEKISKFYFPLVRMDGTDFGDVAVNANGGACGQEWQGAAH
jgi:ectoine hydroxylase-related dioxygenase (phytanoyl-CoA dioxygenase family)